MAMNLIDRETDVPTLQSVGAELAPLSMAELRSTVYGTNRGEGIDFFAGLGGLTAAFTLAGGNMKHACNHWVKSRYAHGENFGWVEHELGDLSVMDPKRLPRGFANILVAAPECRSHSGASNWSQAVMELAPYDPKRETERSRATMWCPQRWAAYHLFDHVVIENVWRICKWNQFANWCMEWDKLGYNVQCASVNSAFFFAPQSRDRVAIVATRKGLALPNLKFCPLAYCWECEQQAYGIQSWKKGALRDAGPLGPIGVYGPRGQYLYSCPACENWVSPYVVPAIAALDRTVEATIIGERKVPLKPKTMDRIQGGLERRGEVSQLVVIDGRTGKCSRPAWLPAMTQTGRQEIAVFGGSIIVPLRRHTLPRPVSESAPGLCASGKHHAIVGPDQRGAVARDADVNASAVITAAGNTFIAEAPDATGDSDQLHMIGGARENNVLRDAERNAAATVTAAPPAGGLYYVGGMRDVNALNDAELGAGPTLTAGSGGNGVYIVGANREGNKPRSAEKEPGACVTTAEGGGGLFVVGEPEPGMLVQVGGHTFERKGPGSVRTTGLFSPAGVQSTTPERGVVMVPPVGDDSGFAVTREAYAAAFAETGAGAADREQTDDAQPQDTHTMLVPAGGTRQDVLPDADVQPAPTRLTTASYASVRTGPVPDIMACTFRMLTVGEAQALMDASWLPDGSPWKLMALNGRGDPVNITQSDGVRLSGNAVCQTTYANVIHRVFCSGEGQNNPRAFAVR